jgi:two-component system NtrC family sensor kinase
MNRMLEELSRRQEVMVQSHKLRAVGTLTAGVAHELNNPIMASQTLLHMLLKNIRADFPERDRLELIGKCNDRIARILDHLREFSRQSKPEFKELDLQGPLENALLISEQQLLDHGITLQRRLSRDLPKINGDANQLEQVFLNLIFNARDAMEETGRIKELVIASAYEVQEAGPCVVVRLSDTGIGIPQENLDKVFEPFFTTKLVGKGTGLGLSICFGIMENHGGRIEIRSQPGQGTEVKVILPVPHLGKESSHG